MESDDVTSPSLFEILLGSSVHVREIVFSECSVLELARFSCASRNSTFHSSEIPYPSDDVIPISVRLQMEKTENYCESTENVSVSESRAFVIGRDRDDCSLVVLAKIVTKDHVAVGIFQKQ